MFRNLILLSAFFALFNSAPANAEEPTTLILEPSPLGQCEGDEEELKNFTLAFNNFVQALDDGSIFLKNKIEIRDIIIKHGLTGYKDCLYYVSINFEGRGFNELKQVIRTKDGDRFLAQYTVNAGTKERPILRAPYGVYSLSQVIKSLGLEASIKAYAELNDFMEGKEIKILNLEAIMPKGQ